ncbi:MAG: hypothetical protein Q9170_004729, partial [Blastenia crenularia]
MVGPETPTRTDDGIYRITLGLSSKWDLRFPQQVFRSPATKNLDRPEEQVLSRLRWLFFHDIKKNQAATTYAIKCFERLAPKLLAGWIPKPLAEEDVLPTRTRSATARHQDFLSKQPKLNDEQASDLMKALLRYLNEAIEDVKKGAIFAIDEDSQKGHGDLGGDDFDTPKNHKPPALRRSTRTSANKANQKIPSPYKDGNIRNYLSKKDHDDPPLLDPYPPKLQQPSSDDYKVDDTLFDDVEMQDAPVTSAPRDISTVTGLGLDTVLGQYESAESLEEQYHTPPDTPSKVDTRSPLAHAKYVSRSARKVSSTNINEIDFVDSAGGVGKKRSLPASSKPEMPRKLSRDTSERRSTGTGPIKPVAALRYLGDSEFGRTRLEQQRSFGALCKSFSTESFSSVGSSGATKAISAWTTPNTSFLTETPATSFDSSAEPFELDYLREKPIQSRRSWQNLKAPFGLGLDMDVDDDDFGEADLVPMGPPPPLIRSKSSYLSVQSLLSSTSPFDLVSKTKEHGVAMPERSSLAAWKQNKQDFQGVALGGSLSFVDQPGEQIFAFKLNPLKIEPAYRLARKFGHDRFFQLTIPSIEASNLPHHLRSDPSAREAIVDWLVNTEHTFLGRRWRVFYVRNESTKKTATNSQTRFTDVKRFYRVYLFAESGCDFQMKRGSGEKDPRMFNHTPITRADLIEWFMPTKDNKKQRALKFFTRLALGVSQTVPTVQFQPGQIVRSDNAFADTPEERCLDLRRSHEKKTKRKPVESDIAVMNDGCARISKTAAKAISNILNIDHTPSVFQGRIAGAKGVWMVDTTDEHIGGENGEFWIEITDSQLKFEASPEDELYPDPERVTFEVHSYCRPSVQANLNFQLMPILADRGVPFEVFSNLLEADLTAKVAELEAAMESGLSIRKWNQDVNTVASAERALYGIEMRGGLPDSVPERINWFVEHGFEPKNCCYLKDLLYKAIAAYCLRLEDRMNIGIAKSTYAYMVADPLAVLEENEVHIAFRNPFDQGLMLHDIDLLVARLPASLPSDVQKVRAVFKLELRNFCDVIVFPCKGDRPLAEKLSGGDYDGDRAWICWEPLIVEPFENAPYVADTSPLSAYGISSDTTKVSDLIDSEDYTSRFLHHAFDFTLQPTMLGICTSYFESFCYAENSISHPSALKIASLLGHLVDRAKAGTIFDENTWYNFIKREALPKKLPKPAYKDKEKAVQPKKTHLIDRLVFDTAKGVRQKVLHSFSKRFKDVGTYDSDVVAMYKNEVEEGKGDRGIAKALLDLKSGLRELKDRWAMQCSRANDGDPDDLSPIKSSRGRGKNLLPPFQARAEQVREQFLAIRPSEDAIALSPIVARWARDAFPSDKSTTTTSSFGSTRSISAPPPPSSPGSTNQQHWTLVKASTAFSLFHNTSFV